MTPRTSASPQSLIIRSGLPLPNLTHHCPRSVATISTRGSSEGLLGVLVMALPWWTRIWDRNEFILARPWLASFLHNGAVRGMISGLGLLDIWIGISEAVHYRDYRG